LLRSYHENENEDPVEASKRHPRIRGLWLTAIGHSNLAQAVHWCGEVVSVLKIIEKNA